MDKTKDNSATEIEIAQTIGAAAAEFDAGELADVAYAAFEEIAEEIANGHASNIGDIIIQARRQRIADIASTACGSCAPSCLMLLLIPDSTAASSFSVISRPSAFAIACAHSGFILSPQETIDCSIVNFRHCVRFLQLSV